MNLGLDLLVGLFVGFGFTWVARFVRAASGVDGKAGDPLLVRWGTGVGRSRLISVGLFHHKFSPPIMREDYPAPAQKSLLAVKNLRSAQTERLRFLRAAKRGWVVKPTHQSRKGDLTNP